MEIRVIIARPGEAPFVTTIENTLEAMQSVVGGYIERIPVSFIITGTPDVDLWVNEEGLLINLPFNRVVAGTPVVGPILVTSSDEEGETTGLSDEQVELTLAILSNAQGDT